MIRKIKLYWGIVLSMIIWSFSFIWTKDAILSFHPVTIITARLFLAVVLMFGYLKIAGSFQPVKKADIRQFMILALFEPFMYYIGETYGLTLVDSSLAAVIIATIPLFAPLFAFLFLKERTSMLNMAGIVVSLCGVLLVIYQPGSGFVANPAGVGLLFFAVASSIGYTIVLQKIPKEYSSMNIIFYQSMIGLVYFIPVFILVDIPVFNFSVVKPVSLMAIVLLSVFASVVAFVLFAGVVRKIGVSHTNVFTNLIPVFTAFLAYAYLSESISTLKIAGIIIVVTGLFVSQLKKFRPIK